MNQNKNGQFYNLGKFRMDGYFGINIGKINI
jgi:hypothetical protein